MMNFFIIISIALALAVDAFAVAVACAAYSGKLTARQKFRLSFHFGLFQFLMPLLGWIAGSNLVKLIADYDHWLAFAILNLIGVKMMIDARHVQLAPLSRDFTRGFSLVSLSIATSIDALAVGFSIGIMKTEILFPAIIIGLVAAIMTLIGIKIGVFLSARFGQKISMIGGLILIFIGIRIVLEHLGYL